MGTAKTVKLSVFILSAFFILTDCNYAFASTIPCNTANEGALTYDKVSKTMEFCNGTNWVAMASSTPSGLNFTEFLSSGTWVVPEGITKVRVIIIGGGGGGAGNTAAGGTGGQSCFGATCASGGAGGPVTSCVGGPNGVRSPATTNGDSASATGGSPGGNPGNKKIEYISGLTSGASMTITVGAGGARGSGPCTPGLGATGLVFIEW